MVPHSTLIEKLQQGDVKALARAITLVENDSAGSMQLLEKLRIKNIPLIGLTGPPGAGKSSLVNALVHHLVKNDYRVGVVAVDPTSPFNFGSLLGDRIRLAEHFTDSKVFIRSLASRGSLGGLSDKIIEVTDLMRAFPFDYLFIETVGVGQSEVEIAGLADTTVVVLVPESGDEVQTMKAGLMEIADIFVVNKADHQDADRFAKNLLARVNEIHHHGEHGSVIWNTPVIKTSAINNEGIEELLQQILKHNQSGITNDRKVFLLAEKVRRLIQKKRMMDVDQKKIIEVVREGIEKRGLNLYEVARGWGEG